ncbi:MAG: LuxR family transcriptional regulator [Ignavibacteriota bacterium]
MQTTTQEQIAKLTKELGKTTQKQKQFRLLGELGEIFYITDPVVALDYAERASVIAEKIGDAHLIGKALTLLGRCRYRTSDFAGARENFTKAIELHSELHDEKELVKLLYLMGNIHLSQTEFSRAIRYYNDCIELAQTLGDKESMETAYNNLGIVFRTVGDLHKAFDYHSRSLQLTLELGLDDIGPVYLNLAIMYYELHELDKAVEYLDKATEAAERNSNRLCIVMSMINKGHLMTDYGNYAEATQLLQAAMQMASDYDFHADRAKAMELLGVVYTLSGEKEKALQQYDEGLRLCEQYNIGFKKTKLLLAKTQLLFDSGQLEEAVRSAQAGVAYTSESGEIPAQAEFYGLLTKCSKLSGRIDEAFIFLEKYSQLREQTYKNQEQKLIREAHIRLEVEAAMREHAQMKSQKEILEQNLSTKNQELTALALQLSKQNEALGKVSAQLKGTASSTTAERSKTPVTSAISEIERLRNSESDWEFFSSQFNVIHAEFGARLLDQFPALSPKEMKVCQLMKLNLSTKDIANTLCLSARTVEVHRYQIRKKLKLTAEENLQSFLAGFGSGAAVVL